MAQIDLNIPLIRGKKVKELVSYLNQLQQDHSVFAICQSLFKAVNHEYLPSTIFSVFLSWSRSLDVIALCIYEGPTSFIRRQGIKQFGRALMDPEKWQLAWEAVGGTKSLVALIAKISVVEVQAFARVIGCCNRVTHKVEGRENAIEELLQALLPSHYPASKLQSQDKRPIQDHYAQMVTACSAEFVAQLLDDKDKSNPLYRRLPANRLIKTHGELLQKRVIESLFGDGDVDDHLHQYLRAFVYSEPPTRSLDPQVSASMAFAKKILHLRLGDIDSNKRWSYSQTSESQILFSLFRRSVTRKLPEAKLHDVIMLGLKLVEAKPELKPAFQTERIWPKIVDRWKKMPELYEDTLVLALCLELSGSQKTIGQNFLETSRALGTLRDEKSRLELRWLLLRLYCLHVPKKGIDLNTVNDFRPLAEQPWSTDIFSQLGRNQAVRLLKGLHSANPEYTFLRETGGISILSNRDIIGQRNFNVVLLLTMLTRDLKGTLPRAVEAVDKLRKKAVTAREQPDRAQFAKAASAYAIASGSLDLYGETVIWQQRYVRDPLTVKVLFGRDAVYTSEGIELLSGIPQPLPEDINLDEMASTVEKANQILMTFHETMCIAKREPSFHQPDWTAVALLFGAVIKSRVAHAEGVQKHLQSSEAHLYTAIWSSTLVMLEKVNVDFLNQVSGPIGTLLDKLPPTALASTTKAMLEAGNERRRQKDRQPGDDIVERLSYEVLQRLANSDKPELAQELILQTIIDRPDASSWHRRLISVSFLNRLSAKGAHDMLLAFASAIGDKLEEQSYVRVGETERPKSAPPQSLVKVTTVKYLAQLLDNAKFISADAAVDVLVELFRAGTHIDIRLATLDSLLSLLNNLCNVADRNWRSNPLVEKIMRALETVIPVVGSINERRPTRTEEWVEAEETGIAPDISDISAGLPPLLAAILRAPVEMKYPGLNNLQAEFVPRLFLPILRQSQAEHRKWVTLFLNKHKVNFTIDDLPPSPITPKVWDILVRTYPNLIPQAILNDFNKHIVITIAPPAALKIFNNSLTQNIALRNTSEVQHWLLAFGERIGVYSSVDTEKLVRMIHHDRLHPSIHDGIAFSQVLDIVITHASLFLDDYEKYTNVWNHFVHVLRHPMKSNYPHRDANDIRSLVSTWQGTGRVVLEKVTALVLDRKKQYTREHKHTLLPSTTKLRLLLLPYPCYPPTSEVESQCKIFAREMEILLDDFLKGGTNILRWPSVAEDAFTASKSLNTAEEQLWVAFYIGKLREVSGSSGDSRLSALNFVRLTLAMKLIENGRDWLKPSGKGAVENKGDHLRQHLIDRVKEWEGNSDENIREKVGEWKREFWRKLISVEGEEN
ncbi:hypothetical protein B7494_g7559 [Chlorociboria aeruginascens]|nr:hypothetical protein B7494_g7559 [Chlorociboria aeruginascens]